MLRAKFKIMSPRSKIVCVVSSLMQEIVYEWMCSKYWVLTMMFGFSSEIHWSRQWARRRHHLPLVVFQLLLGKLVIMPRKICHHTQDTLWLKQCIRCRVFVMHTEWVRLWTVVYVMYVITGLLLGLWWSYLLYISCQSVQSAFSTNFDTEVTSVGVFS